jgi:uncharacterized protein with GYD domain
MALYLVKSTLTPQAWAGLLANPEDRREALRPTVEAAGGKLHGYWYALSDADAYALLELPDDAAVASLGARTKSSGAFAALEVTKLITVEEMLEALKQGSGIEYRAPGQPQ